MEKEVQVLWTSLNSHTLLSLSWHRSRSEWVQLLFTHTVPEFSISDGDLLINKESFPCSGTKGWGGERFNRDLHWGLKSLLGSLACSADWHAFPVSNSWAWWIGPAPAWCVSSHLSLKQNEWNLLVRDSNWHLLSKRREALCLAFFFKLNKLQLDS